MATSGDGSVLNVIKYNYTSDVSANVYSVWTPMPTGTTIDLVAADTVRINLPRKDIGTFLPSAVKGIRVTLVADLEGNYLEELVSYTAINAKATLGIKEVKATATDTITMEVYGKLSNVNSSDFKFGGKSLILDNFTTKSNGNTLVTFKLAQGDKVSEDVYYGDTKALLTTVAQDDIGSQDAFGSKVTANTTGVAVLDRINPTVDKIRVSDSQVTVKFGEKVNVTNLPSVVTVKVNGTSKTVSSIVPSNGFLVINVDLAGTQPTDIVEVRVLEANDTVEAITDAAGNAATSFQEYVVYSEAAAVVLAW